MRGGCLEPEARPTRLAGWSIRSRLSAVTCESSYNGTEWHLAHDYEHEYYHHSSAMGCSRRLLGTLPKAY
jgi:hypothetical protein